MEYRRLGRTELQVSVLGVGCGYLSMVEYQEGIRLLERAVELGVNYFDGRYGDSSAKLAPLLARNRDRYVIVTKTNDVTAEGALQRVDEDLVELGSDYIDIYLLRAYTHDLLKQHLAPGGSMEGLLKAREQGKIRFVGLSGHSDPSVLVAGIETGLVDVILFPLNIVRREALDHLIPVAIAHDVGLAVMKPVSVGAIPAEITLPWIMNQPIHTMVPGVTTLEELERDVAAVERNPVALSPQEEATVEEWRQKLDRLTCRICDEICQPVCEKKLNISWLVHHDVWYNHYRAMGLDEFLSYPWAPWAKKSVANHFARHLALVESCTRCGKCEQACPYHLPIMDMLEERLENHPALVAALQEQGWAEEFREALSPYEQERARAKAR